jgi:hypothetical protein
VAGGMELDFQGNQIPLFGNFIADPANEKKRGSMHNMALAYQAYRPEVAQARMQALNNQMSMFAPLNAMLGQMYGQGAQFDLSKATQSPLTNRAMNLGAPTGAAQLNERGPVPDEYTGEKRHTRAQGAFDDGKAAGGSAKGAAKDAMSKFSPGKMK